MGQNTTSLIGILCTEERSMRYHTQSLNLIFTMKTICGEKRNFNQSIGLLVVFAFMFDKLFASSVSVNLHSQS